MKTSFFLCFFCVFATLSYAEKTCNPSVCDGCFVEQTPEDRDAFKQKVMSMKIAYLTDKLSLTPAEAEKFWPLYNAYFDERENLTMQFIQETQRKGKTSKKNDKEPPKRDFDVSNLSDADAVKLLNGKIKLLDLERKFHDDLCKLFSPKRVLTYYNAEQEFQRELIQKLPELRNLPPLPPMGPRP